MAGVYLHVPFCGSYCTYCSFYSILRNPSRMEAYCDSVEAEAMRRRDFFRGAVPDTLYFGGGTPSVLPLTSLKRLAGVLKGIFFGGAVPAEFTVEVNPDDVTGDLLDTLLEEGVNRLSIGVQSFNDDHLRMMNRRHDSAVAVRAFESARNAGFDNISIDLIFGFRMLTRRQWEENVDTALSLRPEHISCYQLSVEKGSALWERYRRGDYVPLEDEKCAAQYSLLTDKLAAAGYEHYEISSFALDGRRSRHNSSYWDRSPYIGLGPAAHSFDGFSVRLWNPSSLKAWRNGEGTVEERLSERDVFNETVMLSLRRKEGLDLKTLHSGLLAPVRPVIDRMTSSGLLERQGDTIRIPSGRLFVSDGIISELFV